MRKFLSSVSCFALIATLYAAPAFAEETAGKTLDKETQKIVKEVLKDKVLNFRSSILVNKP